MEGKRAIKASVDKVDEYIRSSGHYKDFVLLYSNGVLCNSLTINNKMYYGNMNQVVLP